MEETEHRGYYTRGYLPHIDDPDRAQMVTYRLDDALPREARRRIDEFRSDGVWQRGYFDRYIRDKYHFFNVRCYIILNPVKAGLVDDPFEWPHSSIHHYDGMEDALRRWFRRWKERFWKSC